MNALVLTGRFQPLHLGHISLIRRIKELYPSDLLIICIVRNSNEKEPLSSNAFYSISKPKQSSVNNPLPNWNRYMLLSLAIKSDPYLSNNTEIIFRNRSDLDWEESVEDLPKDRIFIFPKQSREPFDEEKIKYYMTKNEKIQLIDCSNSVSLYSGQKIRDSLLAGNISLDFLPLSCREYFQEECLQYFVNNPITI